MDPAVSAYLLGGAIVSLVAGWGILVVNHRRKSTRLRHELDEQRQSVMADARKEAEAIQREARLLANEEVLKLRDQSEQQQARRRLELDEFEKRVAARERLVNQQLERLVNEEEKLRNRGDEVQ